MRKIFQKNGIIIGVLLALLWGTVEVLGNEISQESALNQAHIWMKNHPIMNGLTARKIDSFKVFPEDEAYSVYIISFQGGGYLVLNRDDRLPLIVTFSPDTRVELSDDESNGFRALLLAHVESIEGQLSSTLEPSSSKILTVNTVTEDEFIGPLLETVWSQDAPYNKYCPEAPNGYKAMDYRAPAGCVPVAYAQVLKFNEWPPCGIGTFKYIDGKGSLASTHSVALTNTYAWAQMLNSYEATETNSMRSEDAVAELIYELGVLSSANYEADNTVSSIKRLGERLETKMYYDSFKYHNLWQYLKEPMETDLREGFPCVVTSSRHAFVIDGLMVNDGKTTYHINYGWGEDNNGWWSSSTIPGGAISSGITDLRPRLITLPVTNTVTAQNLKIGEPIELQWFLPKHRTNDIAAFNIEEWKEFRSPWSHDASFLPENSVKWSVVTQGHCGAGWHVGPSALTATLVLDETLIPNEETSLSFWMSYAFSEGSFTIEVSTDEGSTYSELFCAAPNPDLSWKHYSVSLSDYAGTPIKLRMVHLSSGEVWVDDLRINSETYMGWETLFQNCPLEQYSETVHATSCKFHGGSHTLSAQLVDTEGVHHELSPPVTLTVNYQDSIPPITVTNLTATQLPGTKTVQINYDLVGETNPFPEISLWVSNNTESIFCTDLQGAVGHDLETGTHYTILWNAGADWNIRNSDLEFTLGSKSAGGKFRQSTQAHVDTRDYVLTVASDFGCPVPSSGFHVYPWGSTVACSVTSSNEELSASWIGTGSVPSSGSAATTGEIALDSLTSSIEWQWKSADSATSYDIEEPSVGNILYVYLNNTTPEAPFDSWDHAATNIQDAVDAAIDGDTILIADGEYRLFHEIYVPKNLTLQSVNGPETTILNGQKATRCLNLGTSACTLNGLTITNAYSSESGGGIYCSSKTPIIRNCIIIGNKTAKKGGGIYGGAANNCLIRGNTAEKGGGIYGGAANNCIVWNNTASSGANLIETAAHYTCSPNVTHGLDGCITNAPGLADGFHLEAHSPCIGAGHAKYATGTDMNGEFWKNPPSMGCDERSGNTTPPRQVSIESEALQFTPNLTVNFYGQLEGTPTHLSWTFDDGSGSENTISAAHSWKTAGDYAVILTAYNDFYPAGLSATQTVSVLDPIESAVYVSTNGNDTNDGSDWERAKATILAGMEAQSILGGWVLLAPGTYALSNEVAVCKPIRIRSAEGPETTTIDGQETVRCFNLANSECILDGLTIEHGYSSGSGGGIYCVDTTPVVTNCIIRGNKADAGGGMAGGSAIDCAFSNNQADNGGGMAEGAATDCTFSGNQAADEGGGLYDSSAYNCRIQNNTAAYGGGLSHSTADDCTIYCNMGTDEGGGMYNGQANSCLILENIGKYGGGGGMASSTANSCIIKENKTRLYGGGVYECTINNSLLCANSGGGAYASFARNCTIINNDDSYVGGGGMDGSTAFNCIIWNNSAPENANLLNTVTYYCCSPDVPHGEKGCITNAPEFLKEFHLSANSSCIGAGSAAYLSGMDIDGETWQSPPSMGCDEYVVNATGALQVSINSESTATPGGALSFSAQIQGTPTRLIWDFGDETHETNMTRKTTHAWNATGQYEVVLIAYNLSHPEGVSTTVPITIVNPEDYAIYVATTGNDANDGSSWIKAKATVQAGVNAQSLSGGWICTAPGTYALENEIFVDKAVTIKGNETIIDGQGSVRCFNLGISDCTLDSLTISNGLSTYSGGGVCCFNQTPLLTNCLLSGNSSLDYYFGGGGGGVYGGTLTDCIICKNSAMNGGGAMKSVIIGCTVQDNNADSGGGAMESVIIGCTVQDNNADSSGGGAMESVIIGCTVQDNNADSSGGGASDGIAINCIIQNNYTKWIGGGMRGGTAINCLIRNNYAKRFGGGMASYGTGAAVNCTICNNSAAESGGGIIDCTATNCIIYYNEAPEVPNCTINDTFHCCSPELWEGLNGCTINAPRFVDSSNGNYRLAMGSPCIDSGYYISKVGTVDIEGLPRTVYTSVDMGAYEYQAKNDTDHDNIPDDWERLYFDTPEASKADALAANRTNTIRECYIADLDPLDPYAYFSCALSKNAITWDAVSNRLYNVYWSTNLLKGFRSFSDGRNLEYPQNHYTNAISEEADQMYYKISVELK